MDTHITFCTLYVALFSSQTVLSKQTTQSCSCLVDSLIPLIVFQGDQVISNISVTEFLHQFIHELKMAQL